MDDDSNRHEHEVQRESWYYVKKRWFKDHNVFDSEVRKLAKMLYEQRHGKRQKQYIKGEEM